MKEEIVLHGVVLSEHSLREFDKRLQLLTMERGKMTVWASGAKRPNSPLLAGSRSFVFGKFHLREGKAGYTLRSVEVDAYFEEIAKDLEKACYAAYFLELAELVAQENLEAPEMVELLFLSLKLSSCTYQSFFCVPLVSVSPILSAFFGCGSGTITVS